MLIYVLKDFFCRNLKKLKTKTKFWRTCIRNLILEILNLIYFGLLITISCFIVVPNSYLPPFRNITRLTEDLLIILVIDTIILLIFDFIIKHKLNNKIERLYKNYENQITNHGFLKIKNLDDDIIVNFSKIPNKYLSSFKRNYLENTGFLERCLVIPFCIFIAVILITLLVWFIKDGVVWFFRDGIGMFISRFLYDIEIV